MAQAITAPLIGDFMSGPGCVIPLADQTGTTVGQQIIGTGGRNILAIRVQAQVFFKTFVVGTATVYPIFSLELASNVGFTTPAPAGRRVDSFQPLLTEAIAAIPGTNAPHSFLLNGFVPDTALNFVRVKVLAAGTSTLVYDVIFAVA